MNVATWMGRLVRMSLVRSNRMLRLHGAAQPQRHEDPAAVGELVDPDRREVL
jgi:hypothetical protein